jgi:aminoglycoside phosphotransferase (APT) family kinase protein
MQAVSSPVAERPYPESNTVEQIPMMTQGASLSRRTSHHSFTDSMKKLKATCKTPRSIFSKIPRASFSKTQAEPSAVVVMVVSNNSTGLLSPDVPEVLTVAATTPAVAIATVHQNTHFSASAGVVPGFDFNNGVQPAPSVHTASTAEEPVVQATSVTAPNFQEPIGQATIVAASDECDGESGNVLYNADHTKDEQEAYTPCGKPNKLRRIGKGIKNKWMKLWHQCANVSVETADPVHETPEDIARRLYETDDCSGARCDFAIIEAMPDAKIEELVRLHYNIAAAKVFHRTKGTYNFVAIVGDTSDADAQQYVVRVPGHGTTEHWTPEDVYMMEREVQLMNYIRQKTTVPIPDVLHHSTDHKNTLGLPYILMAKVPGKNAFSVWFDNSVDEDDFGDEAYLHADIPSIPTQLKRVTFLRSLARIMTELQTLTFNEIGMPIVADTDTPPEIGPFYHWDANGSDVATYCRAWNSTCLYTYFKVPSMCRKQKKLRAAEVSGAMKPFFALSQLPPFTMNSGQKETFTIHHNNLDLQNIFVDAEGDITGIIDWDGSFAAPRCIDTGAAPFFLQKDWMPHYLNNLETSPYIAWKTHYYREIYAAALVEAGNPDAKYATNSPIYQAALNTIYQVGDFYDFLDKLCAEIPHFRMDPSELLGGLGGSSA